MSTRHKYLGLIVLLAACAANQALDENTRMPEISPVDARVSSVEQVAAWAYHREIRTDLDGDGVAERVVIASDVELSPDRHPLWEDGHRWGVYVESARGERTLLYGGFVPNGSAEAAVMMPDELGRRHVLVRERSPHQVRTFELVYESPGSARTAMSVSQAIDQWLPGTGSLP